MVQVGKHKAKISDYGVKETSTGKPYFEVWFDVEGQGSVSWRGFMTDATKEKTLKTLATCGLVGDLLKVADGPIGGALKIDLELEIDVVQEKDKDGKLKKYTTVRWVNSPRAAKFDAALAAQAKNKLAQFSGDWAKVKSDLGVKASEPKKDIGF